MQTYIYTYPEGKKEQNKFLDLHKQNTSPEAEVGICRKWLRVRCELKHTKKKRKGIERRGRRHTYIRRELERQVAIGDGRGESRMIYLPARQNKLRRKKK